MARWAASLHSLASARIRCATSFEAAAKRRKRPLQKSWASFLIISSSRGLSRFVDKVLPEMRIARTAKMRRPHDGHQSGIRNTCGIWP